jgi:hypothetical protein
LIFLPGFTAPAQKNSRSLLKPYLSPVRLDRGSEGAEWRGLHSHFMLHRPERFCKKSIVSSIQTSICEQILKLFLIQPKDIAKECLKVTLPVIISYKNWAIDAYCIDYGFEAMWAAFHNGTDTIFSALIKYACTDFCYHQLCKTGQLYKLDYPSEIKKYVLVQSIARVFTPLFIKHWISQIIDGILNRSDECKQENDQMIESDDFNFIP